MVFQSNHSELYVLFFSLSTIKTRMKGELTMPSSKKPPVVQLTNHSETTLHLGNDEVTTSTFTLPVPDKAEFIKNPGVVFSIGAFKRAQSHNKQNSFFEEKYKDKTIEQLIKIYKEENIPDSEKQWLLTTIYLKVFYLFPHMIKQHKYYLNATLFDEAMQNMSLVFLNAIRRFNPNYGKKFIYYFVGDMLSAMRKTFMDSNIVKLPSTRYKKKKSQQYLVEEAQPADITEEKEEKNDPVYNYISEAGRGLADTVTDDDPQPVNDAASDISTDRVLVSKSVIYSDMHYQSPYDIHTDVYHRELKDWLEEALSKESGVLTEDERMVVILHNGLFGNKAHIYNEISRIRKQQGKGYARSRISQIHTQAITKLTEWLKENGMLEELKD